MYQAFYKVPKEFFIILIEPVTIIKIVGASLAAPVFQRDIDKFIIIK